TSDNETPIVDAPVISVEEQKKIRQEQLKLLNSKTEDFASKISASRSYFKSVDTQLPVTSNLINNSQTEDEVLLDAANEFTNEAIAIYEKINLKKMSPFKNSRKFSSEMAFYA